MVVSANLHQVSQRHIHDILRRLGRGGEGGETGAGGGGGGGGKHIK